MKKRLLAILLAGALLFSCAACSNGENGSTPEASGVESETSDSNTSSSATSEVAAGDEEYDGPMTLEEVPSPTKDPFEKYDPPITVTTVHTANDGAFWFPEGDSIDDNIYTRRFSEELGINYEFLWTCPGSQSAERINTMLASGDLPDFLSVTRRRRRPTG